MKNKTKKALLSIFLIMIAVFVLIGCNKLTDVQELLNQQSTELGGEFFNAEGKKVTKASKDQDLTIKFNVPKGQKIVTLTVDKENKTKDLNGNSYKFKFDGKNLPKFEIKFAPLTFKLLVDVKNADVKVGDLTKEQLANVEYNKELEVTVTPHKHFKIEKLLVNGEEKILVDSKLTIKVTDDLEIKGEATLVKPNFKITVDVKNADVKVGDLTKEQLENVEYNKELEVTVTPHKHFKIEKLLVNGEEKLLVDSKLIIKVTDDLEIKGEATLVKPNFKITVDVKNADVKVGDLTKEQLENVEYNKELEVTVTPHKHFKIEKLLVNGEEKILVDSKLIIKVTDDLEIKGEATLVKTQVVLKVNGVNHVVDNNLIVSEGEDLDIDSLTIKIGKFIRLTVKPGENKKVTSIKFNGEELSIDTNKIDQTFKKKAPAIAETVIEITIEEIKVRFNIELQNEDFELVGVNGVCISTEPETIKIGDKVVFRAKKLVKTQLFFLSKLLINEKDYSKNYSDVKLKKSATEEEEVQFFDCVTFEIEKELINIEYEYSQYVQVNFKNQLEKADDLAIEVNEADVILDSNKRYIKKGAEFVIVLAEGKTVRRIEQKINSEAATDITNMLNNNRLTLVATDNDSNLEHTLDIKFFINYENLALIKFSCNLSSYVKVDTNDNVIKKFFKKVHTNLDEIEIDKNINFKITIPTLYVEKEEGVGDDKTKSNFQMKGVLRLIIDGVDRTDELLNSAEEKIEIEVNKNSTIVIKAKEYKYYKPTYSFPGFTPKPPHFIKTDILALPEYTSYITTFDAEVGVEGSGKTYIIAQEDYDRIAPQVTALIQRVTDLSETMNKANFLEALKIWHTIEVLGTEIKTVTKR